jgi:hypothetical protein
MGGLFVFDVCKKKIKISVDIIDILILAYLIVLLVVSFVHQATLQAYIYGFRYDVGFLLAFMLFRRSIPAWNVSITSLARIFIISG